MCILQNGNLLQGQGEKTCFSVCVSVRTCTSVYNNMFIIICLLIFSALCLFFLTSIFLQLILFVFILAGANMRHTCTLLEDGDINKVKL